MKVLLVTLYFPPAGGAGVPRPLKFATHLPALGIETHVLAPDDPKWVHSDPDLKPPTQAWVHRVRYVGPRGRRPAEELYGRVGLERASTQASLLARRFLVPDENVSWNLTAIPTAIRLVRREGIDVVLTTSPPGSVHLIGAAVKRATGIRWVADLRDSLGQKPDRRFESRLVRMKERTGAEVARLVARTADATVVVGDQIEAEMTALRPRGPVALIPNGCDFEDFAGLEYHPADRFRLTHTGGFFGKRDPRPFLTALAESKADMVVRFVGDFRQRDMEIADELGLGDRLEVVPYVPRHESLRLQRDSEALLLLIADADGRGRGVITAKIFEYLAAERPILAAVPPDGEAARIIRDTGAGIIAAPDDVEQLREALVELESRWRQGRLGDTTLSDEWRERLSRRTRVEELAELLRSLS